MIIEFEPRCRNCKHQQMINDSNGDSEFMLMTCHFCGCRYRLAIIPLDLLDDVKERSK